MAEQSYQPNPDVVAQRVQDEVVLVNLRTNEIYTLNKTAARAWELIAEGRDRSGVEAGLAEEFTVEEADVPRRARRPARRARRERADPTRMTAVDLRAGVEALSSTPPSFLAHYSVEAGLELAQGRDETAIAAGDETCTVVFAGRLVDQERLGGPASAETQSTAKLLLAAYRARGEAIFGDLRGVFAVVIHDRRKDTLLFARDQLGHHSLFFARESGAVHLSDSIARLVRHPEVPSSIDRVVVAEMLIHRTRSADETGFESVKRARSGWLYRLERSTLSAGRYWFPVAPDGATEWASEEELPEFEGLMAAAVRRSVEPGATGIFLSGGLDSVTVATLRGRPAHRRRRGAPSGTLDHVPGVRRDGGTDDGRRERLDFRTPSCRSRRRRAGTVSS